MKVLVIEDETSFRNVVESQMAKEEIDVVGVGTVRDGLEQLESLAFDLLITDLRLPDGDGLEVVRAMREKGIEIPVLLMTAYASVSTAVAALQAGASDYLIKPVRVPDLIRRARQIFELDQLKRENNFLKQIVQQSTTRYWFPETAAGQHVKQMLAKVSKTDLTVLITGESGTGKGMTARMIHNLSSRAERPLVPVNCGAIPETLVESELFGHVKGAFTGADKAKDGLFVGANGGTLFLDEIGELPLPMQVKLLHAIEEKTVRPLGSSRSREVDVRIIAATNRNLEDMVQKGTFRMDLYYRLNIFEIHLPPLRQQRSAMPAAIDFILQRYRQNYQLKDIQLDNDAESLLLNYNWPGNLRELENVLERAILLCENNRITRWDLPPNVIGDGGASAAPPSIAEAGGGDGWASSFVGGFREQVAAFERALITNAISAADGDRRAAAQRLGIGLSTLYRKLEDVVD